MLVNFKRILGLILDYKFIYNYVLIRLEVIICEIINLFGILNIDLSFFVYWRLGYVIY